MAFTFIYNPDNEALNEKGYAKVTLEGGNVDSNLDEIFDLFVQFLRGCGYTPDSKRIGYGNF